jgi:hypothetical protein
LSHCLCFTGPKPDFVLTRGSNAGSSQNLNQRNLKQGSSNAEYSDNQSERSHRTGSQQSGTRDGQSSSSVRGERGETEYLFKIV